MEFMDLTKKYLTYQVLTGQKYRRSDLISYIETLPAKHLISIITQVGAFPDKINNPIVRAAFISFLKTEIFMMLPSDTGLDKRLSEYVLYTPQGLLNVCKWLLAHGKFDKEESDLPVEKGIIVVINLCIIVSDYMGNFPLEKPTSLLVLPKHVLIEERMKKLPYEVLRNIAFNRDEDIASVISRALFITTNIATNITLFEPKEYVDCNVNFKNYYGYTVLEYVSVLFVLFLLSQNKSGTIKLNNYVSINQIFQKTSLRNEADKIAKELTLTVEEAKKWALGTLEETWDVSLLAQKPLLTFDGDNYIPILPRMFTQDFFIKLKIKMENSFDRGKERRKFTDFWGRPFEKYVEFLAQEVCNGQACNFISEFKYGGKRSPDVILCLDDKIIAIEAKARYLRTDSIFTNSIKKVDEDINRMVVEPLKQVHDRIHELRQLSLENLHNVKEIFLVSVTMGEFPVVPILEDKIKYEIYSYFKMPVKGYAHLSIEEYEMLCEIIERGENVFDIMSEYVKANRHIGFRDFLITNSYKPKRCHKVNDIFLEKAELITDTIGFN